MEYYNELPPTSLTSGATDRASAASLISSTTLCFRSEEWRGHDLQRRARVSSESAAYWQGTDAKPLDALTTTLLQLTTFPNDPGVSTANP
jgi:hypothetical protein